MRAACPLHSSLSLLLCSSAITLPDLLCNLRLNATAHTTSFLETSQAVGTPSLSRPAGALPAPRGIVRPFVCAAAVAAAGMLALAARSSIPSVMAAQRWSKLSSAGQRCPTQRWSPTSGPGASANHPPLVVGAAAAKTALSHAAAGPTTAHRSPPDLETSERPPGHLRDLRDQRRTDRRPAATNCLTRCNLRRRADRRAHLIAIDA